MDCRYFDYGQILDNYRVCAKCKRRASNHNLLNQIISSTTINLDLSIMIQNYLKLCDLFSKKLLNHFSI